MVQNFGSCTAKISVCKRVSNTFQTRLNAVRFSYAQTRLYAYFKKIVNMGDA
jgi:hypothetical protein